MRSFALATALAAASLVQAGPTPTDPELPKRAASLPTVTASGNAFYAGKDRFYVRGIDYQPGGSSDMKDPLSDDNFETFCKRDAENFKKLGVNTVRVYITDNSASHDKCMTLFASYGIYVILDLNNPLFSINTNQPHESYNEVYLQSVFASVDTWVKYDNTLAFFTGNEVVNDQANSTLAAPYVKATTRDVRTYIASRKYRRLPVGYSAADVSQNRFQLAKYFNCGTDDERSDFFAFNDYSWCNSSFTQSGWDQKVKNFTDYGLPLFLSEYGCITNGRSFLEIEALMNAEMTPIYSGGLVFEYTNNANKYGLVQEQKDGKVSLLPDFDHYSSALHKFPAPTGNGGAASTTHSVACPTKDPDWLVDSTLLPAIPDGAQKFMKDGAGKGPGLKGDGSQHAQGTSTGDAKPGSGGGGGAGATGASKSSDNGAPSYMGPMDKSPLYVSGVVFMFTLVGALIL